MKNYESGRPGPSQEEYFVEDYNDKPYYPILLQLPPELQQIHLRIIETQGMDDRATGIYLEKIIQSRREAVTISVISDKDLESSLGERRVSFLRNIETTVFESADIGIGGTAHIKDFLFTSGETRIPMAIKFVTTPRKTTVSAATEHNILREVERIKTIESIEHEANLKYLHVPHPYFHHKTDRLQCYGMEKIDGISLLQINEGAVNSDLLESLHTTFSKISEAEIIAEIERFCARMHTYCLHNDITPGNIMVSPTGKIYLIDFGESVLVADASDTNENQFDNLTESEVMQIKTHVQNFLKKMRK